MSKNKAFLHGLLSALKAYFAIERYRDGFTSAIKASPKLKMVLNVSLACELSLTA
jgi:hypothetical protein